LKAVRTRRLAWAFRHYSQGPHEHDPCTHRLSPPGVPVAESYDEIFSRHRGLITPSEQSRLSDATVGIAGMGGVGGLLAERLVRLGVGGLRITDPGDFEESNLNRQYGSSSRNLGLNKAEAVWRQLKDINPDARIQWDARGVYTDADAERLTQGCDLVIDEMDLGLFRESIRLQRAARSRGLYCLFASAIGFGALVVIFDPQGMTLEEYDRLPPDLDLDADEIPVIPLERMAPVMPSYARAIPPDEVQRYISAEMPGPSTCIGAGLAAVLAATETMNIILKRREIPTAPSYTYIDLLDQRLIVESAGPPGNEQG